MIRPLRIAIVIVIVAVGALQSNAQSPSATASSQMELDEAKRLNKLVVTLFNEGKSRDAVVPAKRALELREKALGPMHPDVATSLNNLAELYRAQGAFTEAEPLYLRALAIREKALGPKHSDVAESLVNVAELYQDQGEYAKAEPLLVRALDIRQKALGPIHPLVAESLVNLAAIYQDQGAYAKAEPLLVRALDILEKLLGPSHPDVATSLNNLALLYQAQGAFAKAEPLYSRALDIREKVLGPTHPRVATSLNNLAGLYWAQGEYAKAEKLFVRALDIFEKTHGPTHPDVASSLNNLAVVYEAEGAYAKAEPLYVRALHIREKALGLAHPDVAQSMNNLAELYEAQGAYAKAEPLFVRAIDLLEKALGPIHPSVANSLNNLGLLYEDEGAYAKAEPLYARALDIREKALGHNHPDVAASLNNLAGLYQAQRVYAKAEPLYLRALGMFEKAFGPIHPDVASSLNNLAELYRSEGAYAKAEPLYVRALDIRERALGPSHPDVALSLNNFATFYLAQGAYDKAEALLARAADVREQQLRNELGRLSQIRKRALMSLVQGETESLVSFHSDTVPRSTIALELAFTTVLRRKGRILDSLVDNETALHGRLTPQLQDLLDQMSKARSELVAHLYAPDGPPSATAERRDAIAAIRVHIDELESALSTASEDFRTQVAPVTLATVRAALPADAALIEFVLYHRFDPGQAQQPWKEERYVAYLLPQHGPPRWVALGDAAPIDAAVDAVLATMDSRILPATAKAALQRLDTLAFAQIRAQLPGISHVILAPDGKLNLVPFEALIDPLGHYALESYLVSYVSSGRDLLRFKSPLRPHKAAVIIAGPNYGPLPPSPASTLSFLPLAGATAEATDLAGYFPGTAVTGDKATKSALENLTGPAMLHVATHGFYGWPAGLAGAAATRSARLVSQRAATRGLGPGALPPPPPTRDPVEALDQSGLAMAGANRGPDGIVTAREIAGFDWWGTQLVVLSACETGVGAVASGDGVYGLRRALVIAGAASQVVSLWSVSDLATRALMRDYYGALKQGIGRAEALRQAKLRMLHQPGYVHPFYWAAFIPAGDWRPLDASVFPPQRSQP